MWLIAEYEAVSLFSLKVSAATSSGGKSLLTPTPYAVKMALLDVACRTLGRQQAETLWPQIRDTQLALRPAQKVVVTNLFQKILKPYRNPPAPGAPDFGPFQRTIGYREYVQMFGAWSLAFDLGAGQENIFSTLLMNINYLGKRGGFVQLLNAPKLIEHLSDAFIPITQEQTTFNVFGTLQVLDDCAASLTFAKANVYSNEKLKEEDRIRRNIIIPYRLERASKSFSLYEYVG